VALILITPVIPTLGILGMGLIIDLLISLLGLIMIPFAGMSVVLPTQKEKEPVKKKPKSFGEKYR